MTPHPHTYTYAFFGTPDRAVIALEELKRAGLMPALVVTQPDRPRGRRAVSTPTPVKEWAIKESVPVIEPETLDADVVKRLKQENFDAFVVVAYGKILKKDILDIPRRGCINLHASLLPRLRGASPIETAILEDERRTGVTIMLMDELMDHGPIIAQKEVPTTAWPLPAQELARTVVAEGGKLLAEVLPKWIDGKIQACEQDHSRATVARKISKEDGLIDLSDDPYKNFLKWNAYKDWPRSYFFADKDGKRVRVIISDAAYTDGRFIIKKVIPEGRKEADWKGSL